MSLINSFDRTKHLSELDNPLVTNEGVKTPAQRRALALANLFVSGDTTSLPGDITFPGSITFEGAAAFEGGVSSQGATGAGTVPGGTVVATEYGDGINHTTVLDLTEFAVGTGDDAADLAIGALLYTLPAGTIQVKNASITGIFDQPSHGTITDGEVGIGTVVASGAVDTIGEVGATSENVLWGDAGVLSTYVLGTTVVEASSLANVGVGQLTVLSGGVHTLYLNLAATWPNIAAAEAVTFTGRIILEWRKASA